MKRSTKLLLTILGLGLFYCFFKLFTGQGGGGLGDFFDALALTSLILFITALLIILVNVRQLRKHVDTFIFLLLSLPITIGITKNIFASIKYNQTPDLSPKYPRPVSLKEYFEDSSKIAVQIDSLIALQNSNTGGVKVAKAFIDTIIYSQAGKQIFISYVRKFEYNELDNDLAPAYLSADEKDSIYWHLEEGAPNAVTMSGNYHDITSLKKAVRQFYFNQYSFLNSDSLKENYFWKTHFK